MRAEPPALSGFGDFVVLRPLHGGHRNAVWLVAQDGVQFVAKSSRRTEAALDWLAPLHHLARQAGFVVPKMVRSAQGRLLSAGWVLERFVDGHAATASDLHRLTAQIAQMHHLGRGMEQRPGFCSARALCHVAQGGDVDMAALPPDLADKCRQAWADLPGSETAIHADFGAGNVIFTDDGPALIDWDEARLDLPLFDLPPQDAASRDARMAWEIACSWTAEPDHARALAKTWRYQGA